MKYIFSIIATLGILFLGLLVTPSFAQTDRLDLTVTPVFFDYTTEPGKEITDKIRLRNNGNAGVNLKVQVKKLTASDIREANLEDPKPEDTFIQWVKLDKPNFTATPQEWIDIPFTISVPTDASFGYYMAFTVSQDTTGAASGESTAVIQGEVAVPVLLNVKSPNTKAEAELVEFKPKSFINEYLPVEFDVKLRNTGNVHLKPRGNIFIRGNSDKDLALLEVNEGMSTVLPQGSRVYNASWNDGFLTLQKDESTGQTKYNLKANWDKLTDFRIGPYTASLLMVYDNGTRDVMLESKTTFWVFPWKIIGGAIIALLLIIFGIKFMIDSYIKSQMKRRSH
jgi:hypothetical protein